MKAVRIHKFGGTDGLSVDEVATPEPGEGQILIRTRAAGVNFADIMLREGRYLFRPDLPFTPGFEAAGTIEAIGQGVTGPEPGQRVLAMSRGGGYAEFVAADAGAAIPIPEGMDFAPATALLVQGLTALGLLHGVTEGTTILIHAAAGGVGSLLVQLAKLRGAVVIGTASNAEKLELVKRLGADATVDYTNDAWPEKVRAAAGGDGADLIIEMVGGDLGRRNFECLKQKGRMIVYGAASGEDFEISALGLLSRMQTVSGYNLNLETQENIAAFAAELMKYYLEGRLTVSVTDFPLEKAADAHKAIESRRTTGKVVLTV